MVMAATFEYDKKKNEVLDDHVAAIFVIVGGTKSSVLAELA